MAVPSFLLPQTGTWQGSNRLHDPHSGKPEDLPSAFTLTPILNGTFARIEYSWAYHGTPHSGMILITKAKKSQQVTVYWSDTWHMADSMLVCEGAVENESAINVRGSYAAPPG